MPTFSYVAINEQGKEVSGTLDAPDESGATRALEAQDLMPVKVFERTSEARGKQASGAAVSGQPRRRRKVVMRDIIDFSRQLVTLLKAGVPILSSLETLAGQADNPAMSEILIQVASDISSGLDLSAALKKHPKVFSELYVNAVKAGEAGGVLDEVLTRLTVVMKRDADVRKSVKGALRYPTIVVTGMVIAFIVMVTVVVPKFAAIFAQVGMDLPLPTKLLIFIANFVQHYWYIIILVVGGVTIALRKYLATETGQRQFDALILKVPIFGPLLLKTAMTRFTSMFETLSRSGLPILQIFHIVANTIGNKIIGEGLMKAAEGIEHGRGISVSLAETGLFPPLVVRMISVGEESGAIDDMLGNISEYYDAEVKNAVEGLTAMIEPLLTVGMGLMVLVLALAIFLPMWNMIDLANQAH
jgi:type II secretory pathway component PulF